MVQGRLKGRDDISLGARHPGDALDKWVLPCMKRGSLEFQPHSVPASSLIL